MISVNTHNTTKTLRLLLKADERNVQIQFIKIVFNMAIKWNLNVRELALSRVLLEQWKIPSIYFG